MNREKRQALRMTGVELQEIRIRAGLARLTASEYIRRVALGREIIVMEGLPELAKRLGEVGSELNHMVVLLRERGIENVEVKHLQEEVNNIWQSLSFQTGKIR